jgi:hypothetical protein
MGTQRLRAMMLKGAIAGVLLAVGVTPVMASVSYNTGVTYIQDFNSLPTTPENASLQATAPWKDDTLPASGFTSILGWYLYHPSTSGTEVGANGHQRLRAASAANVPNTGSFYSFGSTNATGSDRALGDVGSTTTVLTHQQAARPSSAQTRAISESDFD